MFTVMRFLAQRLFRFHVGPERKSAFIEQKNREVVAYHEGGHALVAVYTSGFYYYFRIFISMQSMTVS